jgi:hypothetical protein
VQALISYSCPHESAVRALALADQSNDGCMTGLPIFFSSSSAIILLHSRRGIAPNTPKLQSMNRHGTGMPRMCPAIRASGITPPQANQAERDDPLVPNRVDEGANECNGDHEMSKRQPVCTVGKEGIVGVRCTERLVYAFDPRKQAGGFGNRPPGACVQEGLSHKPCVYRRSGHIDAHHLANYQDQWTGNRRDRLWLLVSQHRTANRIA